ncbi:MAG: sigma-54 dependent transcriptional regulator [Lautropia sp.]|nr:sigma-54 dependent transcriptional regulator [Lautropia sp.]
MMERHDSALKPLARDGRLARVLVVDDEESLRELLELTLVGMGLDVDLAADLASARKLLGAQRYSLCLTDMRLPDGNGLDLVRQISESLPDTPVAVITAYGSAENAVAALKAGAFDYLAKPVGLDALRTLVRSALKQPQPSAGVDRGAAVSSVPAPPPKGQTLQGLSPAIVQVRASIERMARSMAPVHVTGESGSGKELAARMIHQMSGRAEGPFIAVNCGAIPENLMESEFFGYRKGAFTGAESDRIGFFMAANGGTLFLDEVADLPLAMQVKLLRAIQEKRIRKVGAVAEEAVDVRIVSATHQNLAQCVTSGRFRQDLFYRLNVIELRMPALRERQEDIAILADVILQRLAARGGLDTVPQLSSMTLRYLQTYPFPGNVRELENILERALAFSDGTTINVEDLGLRPMVSEAQEREPASARPEPMSNLHEFRETRHVPGLVASVPGVISAADVRGGVTGFSMPAAWRGEGDEAAASSTGLDQPDARGLSGLGGAQGPSAPSTWPASSASVEPLAEGGREGETTGTRNWEMIDGVPTSLPDYLDQVERDTILLALARTGHNRTAAARMLGITFRALRYRLQRLGI